MAAIHAARFEVTWRLDRRAVRLRFAALRPGFQDDSGHTKTPIAEVNKNRGESLTSATSMCEVALGFWTLNRESGLSPKSIRRDTPFHQGAALVFELTNARTGTRISAFTAISLHSTQNTEN
jgi:hypothetical protein